MKLATAGAILLMSTTLSTAAELDIQTFNPGTNSIFGVATSLIVGPSEVILVDAQFQKNDAETVVKMIKDTGRKLTKIYISHPDPDFYFGLDTVTAAFPDAEVVATAPTIESIEESIEGKVAFWGPILGENAPTKTMIPSPISSDTLTVDGEEVKIVGLDGPDPKHTFLWVPSKKTALGGVLVYENLHVWLADAATVERRNEWRTALDSILALNPERIISGHTDGQSAEDNTGVNFTRAYLDLVDVKVPEFKTSVELVSELTAAYPDFKNVSDLELGAAVVMGERSWP